VRRGVLCPRLEPWGCLFSGLFSLTRSDVLNSPLDFLMNCLHAAGHEVHEEIVA
jgi:hypothetical protein